VSTRQVVHPAGAPPVLGPYSPGLKVGNLLFLSGQIPLDPATGQVVAGDIVAQTRQVFENMKGLLEAAGVDFSKVVRTTVFMSNLGDFAAMNDVYASYFSQPYPARSTVQVARLPRDVQVEIDVIAVVE
jgi:2-iminobutanoate/2-iminopropanoate deaminase